VSLFVVHFLTMVLCLFSFFCRTNTACPPTWTMGVTSSCRNAAHDVWTISVNLALGTWSDLTNCEMTCVAKSAYDKDRQVSNCDLVTVGMLSGTNKPRSWANPCMTTERKSKCFWPPRVLLYVTEDMMMMIRNKKRAMRKHTREVAVAWATKGWVNNNTQEGSTNVNKPLVSRRVLWFLFFRNFYTRSIGWWTNKRNVQTECGDSTTQSQQLRWLMADEAVGKLNDECRRFVCVIVCEPLVQTSSVMGLEFQNGVVLSTSSWIFCWQPTMDEVPSTLS